MGYLKTKNLKIILKLSSTFLVFHTYLEQIPGFSRSGGVKFKMQGLLVAWKTGVQGSKWCIDDKTDTKIVSSLHTIHTDILVGLTGPNRVFAGLTGIQYCNYSKTALALVGQLWHL